MQWRRLCVRLDELAFGTRDSARCTQRLEHEVRRKHDTIIVHRQRSAYLLPWSSILTGRPTGRLGHSRIRNRCTGRKNPWSELDKRASVKPFTVGRCNRFTYNTSIIQCVTLSWNLISSVSKTFEVFICFLSLTGFEWASKVWYPALKRRQVTAESKKIANTAESSHVVVASYCAICTFWKLTRK